MANPRLRALIWWRRWSKREWAIAVVGFTIVIFIFSLLFDASSDQTSSPLLSSYDVVDLTLLHNAKDRGACTLSDIRYLFLSFYLAFFQRRLVHSFVNILQFVQMVACPDTIFKKALALALTIGFFILRFHFMILLLLCYNFSL